MMMIYVIARLRPNALPELIYSNREFDAVL